MSVKHIVVETVETHDDQPCECISDTVTLFEGDTLELTHTCHDGRVDKVIGKIVSINP